MAALCRLLGIVAGRTGDPPAMVVLLMPGASVEAAGLPGSLALKVCAQNGSYP